jgi:hypothetical protein
MEKKNVLFISSSYSSHHAPQKLDQEVEAVVVDLRARGSSELSLVH